MEVETMRIAVIDDERSFADKVKKDIEKYFQEQKTVKVKCFIDASLLIDLQKQNCYDLYLLDVEMPEVNGLTLAEKIRSLDNHAGIVFLTAHENYARHGYKVKAYDYLLKDSYQEELFLMLERVWKEDRENQEEYYIISSDNKECNINENDIVYLVKEKQYPIFYCKDGVLHRERGTLRTILGRLPKDRFILIDKGTILNLKYVTQFEKCVITLENGERLAVSRRLRTAVQEKLTDYWGGLY